jgi:hypothetical protein
MRISQRNKKSNKAPLAVTETFPFPFESIQLKISGTPDAWFRLYALSAKPKELRSFLYVHFVAPAVRHLVVKRPRGAHKFRAEFINKIKNLSGYNYSLLEYWLKRPEEEWPKPIRKVIRDFEKNETSYSHSGQRLKLKAHEITAYIMEKRFGRQRKTYKIPNPWTDDPESFRRTYISKDGFREYYRAFLRILKTVLGFIPDLPILPEDPGTAILSYLRPTLGSSQKESLSDPAANDKVLPCRDATMSTLRPNQYKNSGCKIAIPQIRTPCNEFTSLL